MCQFIFVGEDCCGSERPLPRCGLRLSHRPARVESSITSRLVASVQTPCWQQEIGTRKLAAHGRSVLPGRPRIQDIGRTGKGSTRMVAPEEAIGSTPDPLSTACALWESPSTQAVPFLCRD